MKNRNLMKNRDRLPKNPWESTSKRKTVVTTVSLAIAWFFNSCDKIPNDQIILDGDKQSVAVSFEYQFGNPESGTSVDYNIVAQKKWDIFEWTVEKSNWISTETINIKCDNLDWLFEEIANKTDSEQITDNTRTRRNAKLDFAKQVYKDSVLNNKNPSKWETIIKYKK